MKDRESAPKSSQDNASIPNKTENLSDLLEQLVQLEITERNTPTTRYPNFDYRLNLYMERARSSDPTCKVVYMNQGDYIHFHQHPTKEEALFTFGLNGCIAYALALESENRISAIMLHLSPLHISLGRNIVQRLIKEIMPPQIKRAQSFLIAPGEWIQNSDGKWTRAISQEYEHILSSLQTSLLVIPGIKRIHNMKSLQIFRLPYQQNITVGSKNQGTFQLVNSSQNGLEFILGDYEERGKVFNDYN